MTDNQRKATVDHSIHLYHAHKGPGIFPPLNLPTARSFGRPGRRRFRSLRVCRQLGTEPWSLDVELIYIYYYMQHILYICTCCLGGLITIYLHATETGCDTSEIRRPVFTVPVLVGRRPSEGRAAFKKCKHIRVKLQLCTGGHTRDLCLGIAGP